MNKKQPNTFSAVLMKDGVIDQWTAHLVELDVAAQGGTIAEALAEVQFVLAAATIRAVKSGEALLTAVGPAPAEYRQRFDNGTTLDVAMPEIPGIDPPLPVAVPTIGEARVA